MILAAGVLVLLGLGLFVGGILTGVTGLYWGCVVACAVAAVLLIATRRQLARTPAAEPDRATADKPRTHEQPAVQDEVEEPPAEPPAVAPESGGGLRAAAHRAPGGHPPVAPAHEPPGSPTDQAGEPPVEEVEVTDLLLVVDLTDEVLVVDEHPRYHLEGCRVLTGRDTIPLPLDEARTDGFTPCGVCTPDRHLADRERARKSARGG